MKVIVDINPKLSEAEVHLYVPKENQSTKEIIRQLHSLFDTWQLAAFKKDELVYLALDEILFFETEGRNVLVHTRNETLLVKHKLYELEKLNSNFMRVSKASVLNISQVEGLKRSFSGCMASFFESYKSVYVSRKYYPNLRDKLEEMRLK